MTADAEEWLLAAGWKRVSLAVRLEPATTDHDLFRWRDPGDPSETTYTQAEALARIAERSEGEGR